MAFEKDLLTGKILSHLYPDEYIRIEGYQKIENRYSGYFDVIASNIPFGDVAVFDPQFSNHKHPAVKQSTQAIHNYFFTKSVQTAREGGIIAFITSQGVLNSEQNKPVREYLMRLQPRFRYPSAEQSFFRLCRDGCRERPDYPATKK